MKRLIIVRHAKSVPYGYDDDFNRPLSERGETDAENISSHLKKQGIVPDLIISSPALRAMTTAITFAETFHYPESNIVWWHDFYEGVNTQEFIAYLEQQPDHVQVIFVFGHNPTVHYLVGNLCKTFNGDMPTCSTVGIDFDVQSWNELEARSGRLAFQYIPSNFK